MKETEKHNMRMASMTFAEVYPHYVTKIQKRVEHWINWQKEKIWRKF